MRGILGRAIGLAALSLLLAATAAPGTAVAGEEGFKPPFGLDLRGSLGEGRHSRYVPPVTNPIFNESPYITTEARAFYFHHVLPESFVTDGGTVDLGAVQLRLALTERLGFIATKDGYANFDFDKVLPDEDGFANIAFGFKYALISRPQDEGILSAGLRYEIPINDLETGGIELQGDGAGFLNPFLTGAKAFGDLGLQASVGANFALEPEVDTSILHYSLHADYEILPGLFPLVEFNGFTPIDHGDRASGPLAEIDGVDVLNFGSEDRDTTLTVGGGLRYRFNDHVQLGTAFETPITDKDDTIFDYRVYVDLVLSM